MPDSDTSAFGLEWTTLQNNYEQYEKSGLLIKLAGMAWFVASLALAVNAALAVALMLIMWAQEGIFRTYQARLGERILRVEQMLRQGSPPASSGFQLHTEWQAQRPGFGGLLGEYGKNMLRPTIAYPYVLLILLHIGWAAFR